jgi:hypothetical protein
MEIILNWPRRLLWLALFAWPFQVTLCLDSGFNAELKLTGGAHRMFRQGVDQPVLEITAWSTDAMAHDVVPSLSVADIFNQPIPNALPPVEFRLPVDGSRVQLKLPLSFGIGYYSIIVRLTSGAATLRQSMDLGIVWPPYPGVRPNSLFASNVAPREGEDLQFLETIGMKVQRTHFIPEVATTIKSWPRELPAGQAVPLNFDKLDREWGELKAHGLWILPIVGYSLAGAGVFDRTRLAEQLGMYGPPKDAGRFIRTWETVLRHYPELTTLEFWNEPWIYDWTWAATPADYRRLQEQWCSMALTVNSHYRLLAGNSTAFVRDNIEPDPECWEGLLLGVTNHPYTLSVPAASWRGGDVFRAIDEIHLTARDLGLPYSYLTEGGTAFSYQRSPDDPLSYDNTENAEKIVQYYVGTALAGVFMGNAQWEIGYGPDWTRSNTAFAVMTHFLEDRVPLVDLWPRQELLWGAIFANRKFATPLVQSLPRGSELRSRWDVEVPQSRGNDDEKVAILWALTGPDASHLDPDGQLVILDSADLHAFTMTGQEIPPFQGKLTLPLSSAPVYVTTERLSVLELRERIQLGVIRHLTPINIYACSLQKDASETQDLTVRVQNQINRYLDGTLVLKVPGTDAPSSARFAVQAGELANVRIPWPGLPKSPDNRYSINLSVHFDNDYAAMDESFTPVSKKQVISVARFAKRKVILTGNLRDWNSITPVTIDSDWLGKQADQTANLLNPNQKTAPSEAERLRILAEVYTAYDDDFVYIGAAVNQDHFHCSAGEPVKTAQQATETLPYKRGEPDGLIFATECGDVFQFSFGFRDRVPGIGRQIGDPWAWKGTFYDADYSFVAHASTGGDRLIRIWGPDTSRRNGYQTEAVPGIGPVTGGTVKITRDEADKLTLYEISIPRRQLALFDPGSGECRFGFVLHSSELTPPIALAWSDFAGVFDYWQTNGSFPPTWKDHLACQTFFGIEQ